MLWQCQLGHQWEAGFNSVKDNGTWCPECSDGISERLCRAILEYKLGVPFPKTRPSWLVNARRNRMEFDGYSAQLHIAFESHGRQHFEVTTRMTPTKAALLQRTQQIDDGDIDLHDQTRQSIEDYLRVSGRTPGQFLFSGRDGDTTGLTTRKYARLVGEWIASIGLDPLKFGTHSMRRTKATLIYRRTGNLRAVQLLLGHTKIESTVRYLGIEIDDAIEISEKIDV